MNAFGTGGWEAAPGMDAVITPCVRTSTHSGYSIVLGQKTCTMNYGGRGRGKRGVANSKMFPLRN